MTNMYTQTEMRVGWEFLQRLLDTEFNEVSPFVFRHKDDVFATLEYKRYEADLDMCVVVMSDECKNFIINLMAKNK